MVSSAIKSAWASFDVLSGMELWIDRKKRRSRSTRPHWRSGRDSYARISTPRCIRVARQQS